MRLRVGILDSGIGEGAAASRRFFLSEAGEVQEDAAGPDRSGHGSALREIIAGHVGTTEPIEFLNAQVFEGAAPTSAAAVAAGLDWLVAEGAGIVNMSFGLRRDRAVLAGACARARAAGAILVAASPARGAPVYPASYDGVIRITGDARCDPGEVSALHSGQADFGAHVRGGDEAGAPAGASLAVAWVVAGLAKHWLEAGPLDEAAARTHLQAVARYHGPERKTGA